MSVQVARPLGAIARTGCTKEPRDGRLSCARRCGLVGDRRQVAGRLPRTAAVHAARWCNRFTLDDQCPAGHGAICCAIIGARWRMGAPHLSRPRAARGRHPAMLRRCRDGCRKFVSGQLDEENPFVLISSGLLVQSDEGVSDLVVDRIGVTTAIYREEPDHSIQFWKRVDRSDLIGDRSYDEVTMMGMNRMFIRWTRARWAGPSPSLSLLKVDLDLIT
ncbi:hypothetical protein F511_26988 [Dorcoceras hygrometricum]|uniref:Uncharacterized protein n=1 Tax=Dorcoceras hygrometricum TaxID=472368 RepID=A0A2Z7AIA9_9LAMI|nr:hypothetical protein F511_26988 [Dorcoceras hygrometricum]